jgi:hypothetical protein
MGFHSQILLRIACNISNIALLKNIFLSILMVKITKYYECKTCLELHNEKEPCPFDK